MSARTQTYLAGSGAPVAVQDRPRRNKLHRDERTGSVLPPPSQWQRGPNVYGHATNGLGGVGQTGYQAYGASSPTAPSAYAGAGGGGRGGASGYGAGGYGGSSGSVYGVSYATTATGGYGGPSGLRAGGGYAGGGTATTSGRLQQKIEEAKEKSKERRERHKAKRRPDEIQQRNLVVDEDGVAHDSEYVQFRTATPLLAKMRQQAVPENPNDDGSASSSSGSESDGESGFHSSPYTYQSTHRTASSHHTTAASLYPSTISAIPPHLASQTRTSLDAGPSSLSGPRATSPHHRASGTSSLYDGASGHGGLAYDRIGPGYGSRVTSSTLRTASSPPMRHHATTASYQPPAPAYNPNDALRLPGGMPAGPGSSTVSGGGGAPSFVDSLAQASEVPGESGYNKAAKAARASSTRPPKMDGTALDAGMHGLNRSWDGFKLDMRFGAHKVSKKLVRKLNSAI